MNYYFIIFFGALFAGESFLIPGVYLILKGVISYEGYMFFGILATIISDSFWYLLGKIIPLEKIISLPLIRNKVKTVYFINDSFKKHGLKILFISKFIYGTRIITQILCGVTKISYKKYITINSIAIFLWMNWIFVLSYLAGKGLAAAHIAYSLEISFLLTLIIIFIIYQWLKKKIIKKWPLS